MPLPAPAQMLPFYVMVSEHKELVMSPQLDLFLQPRSGDISFLLLVDSSKKKKPLMDVILGKSLNIFQFSYLSKQDNSTSGFVKDEINEVQKSLDKATL